MSILVSEWSDPIAFTTAAIAIGKPSIISPVMGSDDLPGQPTFTASNFTCNYPSVAHIKSQWEVSTSSNMANPSVYLVDTGDLRVFHSSVWFSGTIYVRVRYGTNDIWSTWSDVVGYTCVAEMPELGMVINGDIVFALWVHPATSEAYWLLAAPAIKRRVTQWGLKGKDTILPNITSAGTVDLNCGTHNTSVLLLQENIEYTDTAGTIGTPAAMYAQSLGANYFIPNHDQLNSLYLNKAFIDSHDTSFTGVTLSGISSSAPCPVTGVTTNLVWASTEHDSNSARIQQFSNASRTYGLKSNEYWVVPIRRILA